jgi:CheY-like chemotaxis protein
LKLEGSDRAAVLAVFVHEVPGTIARIVGHLDELAEATTPEGRVPPLAGLSHDAHNLRGAAAVLQLGLIESLAVDVELAAEDLLSSRSSKTADLLRATGRLLAQLERSVVAVLKRSPAPVAPRLELLGEGPIVLHIEDNLSNLKLVERVMARRPSIQLVEAQTGEEGLGLARRLMPSLVLLDLRLPDLPGEKVLQRLRADVQVHGLRVVVVSAEARPAEAKRLMGLGADDYLVKPIEIQALLELVDQILAAPAET